MKRIVIGIILLAGNLSAQQPQAQPPAYALSDSEVMHMRAIVGEYDANESHLSIATMKHDLTSQQLLVERAALIAAAEKSHPGTHWVDDQTSQATGHLEANPVPPAAQETKKK